MTAAPLADGRKKPVVTAGTWLAGITSLLCLLLSGLLALHHPLSPAWAIVGVAMLTGLAVWQPRCVWWLPPALLPLIGLAPWTGWIVFEEFDLLLLALLAGGYARLVMSTWQPEPLQATTNPKSRRRQVSPQGAFALVVVALVARGAANCASRLHRGP